MPSHVTAATEGCVDSFAQGVWQPATLTAIAAASVPNIRNLEVRTDTGILHELASNYAIVFSWSYANTGRCDLHEGS